MDTQICNCKPRDFVPDDYYLTIATSCCLTELIIHHSDYRKCHVTCICGKKLWPCHIARNAPCCLGTLAGHNPPKIILLNGGITRPNNNAN